MAVYLYTQNPTYTPLYNTPPELFFFEPVNEEVGRGGGSISTSSSQSQGISKCFKAFTSTMLFSDHLIKKYTNNEESIQADERPIYPFSQKISTKKVKEIGELLSSGKEEKALEKLIPLQEMVIDALSEIQFIKDPKQNLEKEIIVYLKTRSHPERLSDEIISRGVNEIFSAAKSRIQVIASLVNTPISIRSFSLGLYEVSVQVEIYGKGLNNSPRDCLKSLKPIENKFGGFAWAGDLPARYFLGHEENSAIYFAADQLKLHCRQKIFSKIPFDRMFQELIRNGNVGKIDMQKPLSVSEEEQWQVAQAFYKGYGSFVLEPQLSSCSQQDLLYADNAFDGERQLMQVPHKGEELRYQPY